MPLYTVPLTSVIFAGCHIGTFSVSKYESNAYAMPGIVFIDRYNMGAYPARIEIILDVGSLH